MRSNNSNKNECFSRRRQGFVAKEDAREELSDFQTAAGAVVVSRALLEVFLFSVRRYDLLARLRFLASGPSFSPLNGS